MQSLTQFLSTAKVGLGWTEVATRPGIEDWNASSSHYRVTLTNAGRRMAVWYSKGPGHHGEPPSLDEVLNCLALDSAGYENARNFEEWCGEYGYDTDSRKAERAYKAVERQAASLKRLLGEAQYQALLFDTESL